MAGTPAQSGSLAPAPRVVTERDRDFVERSGAQTLEELLDTGIVRYFFTGGQNLPVLVNGRPYFSTASDLDTLPLSAIERIELLAGDTLGALGGSAISGAINIVLRKDLDGFETRALTRLPSREGGDGWQGSVFWGGEVGAGHMTFGADVLRRQEIPSRSRDFSRSVWQQDGAFSEARNVSVSGNTVWVVQRDEDGEVTGVRSVALGECDPAKGYTGPLSNPPGIRNGDKGCGFAFGDIMWNTSRFEQQTAILNLDHPVGEQSELHLVANVGRGDWAYRFAPSVDVFAFTTDPKRAWMRSTKRPVRPLRMTTTGTPWGTASSAMGTATGGRHTTNSTVRWALRDGWRRVWAMTHASTSFGRTVSCPATPLSMPAGSGRKSRQDATTS